MNEDAKYLFKARLKTLRNLKRSFKRAQAAQPKRAKKNGSGYTNGFIYAGLLRLDSELSYLKQLGKIAGWL